MLDDFRILDEFRSEIVAKEPEDIDFDEAMKFYRDMEYKSMPTKW